MKAVLVRPNYDSHIITPPLGIGYLASYLKREGIETIIIDGLKERLGNDDILKKIIGMNPDAIGITCLTAFYNQAVSLSKMLKANNFKVIMGGVHPTFLPYSTLVDSRADFVICGEGEGAFAELMNNNLVNCGIKGVYSLENIKSDEGEIEKADVVEDLDSLPFPDWEQINPVSYPRAPHGAVIKNYPVGIITTSRGCPYECTFCASPNFYGRRIRFRSPENVIDEIELLIKKFGIKEIHFEDDNLTLVRERVEKICLLLKEKNIKISWACPNGIRADKVDRALIKLMAESGCYYFAYGIESANSKILENIKKRETISVIDKAIELADNEGISCQGFFIFGLPGETKETLEENINFALKSKLSRAQFLILDILPGSELWKKFKGQFASNWNKKSYREPEWLPAGLTGKDLILAQSRAFRLFYLRPKILLKIIRLVDVKQIFYLLKRLKDYRFFKLKASQSISPASKF